MNGAFLESSASSRSSTSPIVILQKLNEDYWPLDIDPGKRRGICKGITFDILRGIPVERLLNEQRKRLARPRR